MEPYPQSFSAVDRKWVPDAFGVGSADSRSRAFVLIAILLASAAFGLATVAVGTKFPTRPIFYLAAPVMIMLASVLVLDPLRCFIGLIILRAILDPICVRAQFGGFGGLGGLFNLAIIVLAVLLIATRGKELLTKDIKFVWIPFLVLMALDVVRSPDFVPAFRVWLSLLTYASIFLGAQVCVKNAADLDRMFRWILLTSVPVFIYAVMSFAITGPEFVVEAGEGMSGRLSSPLTHPNILAFYTDVMLAVWLAKTRSAPFDPTLTWRNIGWGALLLMLLVMLAGTQTRSAWVGAFIMFLVYGALVKRSYLVLMVVGVMLALLVPAVRDRVLDLASNNEVYAYSKLNSLAWRKVLWTSGLSWLSPVGYVVGDGTGSFFFHSREFFPLAYGKNWNAHNVYVQLLIDMGVIGVGLYLSIFALAFRLVWVRRSLTLSVRVATLALIGAFAIMSYSDNMIDYLVVNWLLWFVIGLVVASERVVAFRSAPSS